MEKVFGLRVGVEEMLTDANTIRHMAGSVKNLKETIPVSATQPTQDIDFINLGAVEKTKQ